MTKVRNNPELTLYIGARCPFCIKVTNFLVQNQINIAIKDVWDNDDYMNELVNLTGKTQVPCLKINDQPMLESSDIIEFLRDHFSVT